MVNFLVNSGITEKAVASLASRHVLVPVGSTIRKVPARGRAGSLDFMAFCIFPRMSHASQRDRPRQHLHPFFTTWHITFGAHAQRLHGGPRATVDRHHNQRGEPFIGRDQQREDAERAILKAPPVLLSIAQCVFIEAVVPRICERGGWMLRTCSASPPPRDGDHVHVLLDAPSDAEPKVIRGLLKRWLTQEMNEQWPQDDECFRGWWAEGGSTKPVKDDQYLTNAYWYIEAQRATPSAV